MNEDNIQATPNIIQGFLRARNGKPLAGIEARIFDAITQQQIVTKNPIITNSSGYFIYNEEELPPGGYYITFKDSKGVLAIPGFYRQINGEPLEVAHIQAYNDERPEQVDPRVTKIGGIGVGLGTLGINHIIYNQKVKGEMVLQYINHSLGTVTNDNNPTLPPNIHNYDLDTLHQKFGFTDKEKEVFEKRMQETLIERHKRKQNIYSEVMKGNIKAEQLKSYLDAVDNYFSFPVKDLPRSMRRKIYNELKKESSDFKKGLNKISKVTLNERIQNIEREKILKNQREKEEEKNGKTQPQPVINPNLNNQPAQQQNNAQVTSPPPPSSPQQTNPQPARFSPRNIASLIKNKSASLISQTTTNTVNRINSTINTTRRTAQRTQRIMSIISTNVKRISIFSRPWFWIIIVLLFIFVFFFVNPNRDSQKPISEIKGLKITKIAPDQVESKQPIRYELIVDYSGGEDLVIWDDIPNNTTLLENEANKPTKPYDFANSRISWRIKNFSPGSKSGDVATYHLYFSVLPKVDAIINNTAYGGIIGGAQNGSSITKPGDSDIGADQEGFDADFVRTLTGQGRKTQIAGCFNDRRTFTIRVKTKFDVPNDRLDAIYDKSLSLNVNPLVIFSIWGVESTFSQNAPTGRDFGGILDICGGGFTNQMQCAVNSVNNLMNTFDKIQVDGKTSLDGKTKNGKKIVCTYHDKFIYAYDQYTPTCRLYDDNDNAQKNFVNYYKRVLNGCDQPDVVR